MKKILILLAVIAVLLGLTWFLSADRERAPRNTVQTAEVQSRDIHETIMASGNLVFADERAIRAQITAPVIEVLIEEGDSVERDQLLLRLDPELYQAELNAQQSMLAQQQLNLERSRLQMSQLNEQVARQRDLASRQVVGRDTVVQLEQQLALANIDVRQVEQQLRQASVGLEKAQEQLDRTQIRAPMSGVISQLDIKEGEIALSGAGSQTILRLANPNMVWAEVEIDEADIGKIAIGQSVKVFAVAYLDTPMLGQVAHIATSARLASGRRSLTFTVRVEVTDTQGLPIKPGMSARVEILTKEENNALAVPLQALQQQQNEQDQREYFVWLLEADQQGQHRVAKTLVEPGLADIGFQQITGVELGQRVVTGPISLLSSLQPGQLVNPDSQEANDDSGN